MTDLDLASCWTHHNPVRVIAGAGKLSQLPELVSDHEKILLVTTSGSTKRGLTAYISNFLGTERLLVHDKVVSNPQLDDLDKATEEYRNQGITCIVAVGGGSVLDTAKILSVTLHINLSCPLKKIFRQRLVHSWPCSLKVIAIPTTSGTGAEITPFATVWDKTTHRKYSVSGDEVYPEIALLDPELTLTLPYQETLYTALDAISHALESLWNKNRTLVSEAFAIQALILANEALPLVLNNLDNISLRAKMQYAAMLAGLAISQTRTAIAHAVSYPLTINFGVPHGLACSFTLLKLIEAHQESILPKKLGFILNDTSTILNNLNPSKRIRQYADYHQMLALINEMIESSRTNNYTSYVDFDNIKLLLITSLMK